jgi:uncharacterized protein
MIKTPTIWAIADLHLCFSTPEKSMEIFGEAWKDYPQKIRTNWLEKVSEEDLILIAGDTSWASSLDKALIDLNWIAELTGTKLLLRGNHDIWWSSLAQLRKQLPPSLHCIQNDCFLWKGVAIGGSRLWDSHEYRFDSLIDFQKIKTAPPERDLAQEEKVFQRELHRLELSLQQLPIQADLRLAMTHYPPIGPNLLPSRAAHLLEKYQVQCVVFGHLHQVKKNIPLFGEIRGIRYILTAADYLNFSPIPIAYYRDSHWQLAP